MDIQSIAERMFFPITPLDTECLAFSLTNPYIYRNYIMSDFLRIERVINLPNPLTASTMYIVQGVDGDIAELTFTGKASEVDGSFETRHVFNKADIATLVSAELANFNSLLVVADITERDALALDRNAMVLVVDATTDTTVAAGSATYVYTETTDSWTKIAEHESLDVTLTWDSLSGKPASTPAQIDAAVAASHTHANKTQLDKIGESADGNLTYDGTIITGMAAIAVSEW